jgi:hypothetical protein
MIDTIKLDNNLLKKQKTNIIWLEFTKQAETLSKKKHILVCLVFLNWNEIYRPFQMEQNKIDNLDSNKV